VTTILVAGASGHLGRELVPELRRRGHDVRELRRGDPFDEACAGAGAVFSALGGTSRVDRGPRKPFRVLDTEPNLELLAAAERAGVERFAYVSLLNADRLRGNAYVDAHEEVVDALRASPIPATIIRANGFFSAFDELLEMARRGRARLLGPPDARSNPIHDADLAVACADALEAGAEEVAIGGPETMTRRDELDLVHVAAGREPHGKRVPARAQRLGAALLRPVDPRRAAMLDFLRRISEIDMVGPPHGERRLEDYLNDGNA
jgi:uncharacterized protein YbjT (DUF2867 family)